MFKIFKKIEKSEKGYLQLEKVKSAKVKNDINDLLMKVNYTQSLQKYKGEKGLSNFISDFKQGNITDEFFNNNFKLIQFTTTLYLTHEFNINDLKLIHMNNINYANIYHNKDDDDINYCNII